MTEGLDARLVRARVRYEQAVFGGDAKSLDEAERDRTALDADVALARGRLLHARFLDTGLEDADELALFERAAGCTGSWVMPVVRASRFSGWAQSIR